ncbi:hypothetical protein GCM10008961_33490 [Deinococcus knuensis]|uniref:HTH cro/C1-type domain-containing protein n=1 Tax=Deinococcus knuensis TaxID=1837380 RepID=A0ABQ2SSV5_9DEIO|nr:hypothetical protein GCM10008961_33490 [Deinococcus knuensis]
MLNFIYDDPVTWDELEAEIRARAKAAPRGFAASLAERLDTDKSAVSQFLSGRRPIPREHIHLILDALGLELVLKSKNAADNNPKIPT